MLTDSQREIIRATVPALRQHGERITELFYGDLFAAHPALLNVFNPANQRPGGQARSLAASILAYAANIDHLDRLGGMVERIAHKHGSLEVRPEHYPIVGRHLLGAIRQVLGAAATDAVLDAWGAAYGMLADIMIGREAQLYAQGSAAGWDGYKTCVVVRKQAESASMVSLTLAAVDGTPPPAFRPGQYVGVKLRVPGQSIDHVRQYSLSNAPGGRFYRISVRRERAQGMARDGLVSNFIHDGIREGDTLAIHAPTGDFVLDETSPRPVVLLSAGSGITPMISMLEHLAGPAGGTRPVRFLHATVARAQHAFGDHVRSLARQRSGIEAAIFYETVTPDDVPGVHHDEPGRLGDGALAARLPAEPCDFYICGPLGFMTAVEGILDRLDIPAERRHSEVFVPDPSFLVAA
ncbi:MAG TPA: NO-inducible flavohemoprotein [Aliidongia sp.]|uniref:NO-inducible flavohemoprotein n=1 Tax=Aliidongia sp. TaxID=1914230 RepID=UPI002DDD20EB|nr:NO-inducible flavohemoprotein [Aliidongia sp.]HEV2678228.1 NO-inducible flavohemoprotein [Aliidongia sp.]